MAGTTFTRDEVYGIPAGANPAQYYAANYNEQQGYGGANVTPGGADPANRAWLAQMVNGVLTGDFTSVGQFGTPGGGINNAALDAALVQRYQTPDVLTMFSDTGGFVTGKGVNERELVAGNGNGTYRSTGDKLTTANDVTGDLVSAVTTVLPFVGGQIASAYGAAGTGGTAVGDALLTAEMGAGAYAPVGAGGYGAAGAAGAAGVAGTGATGAAGAAGATGAAGASVASGLPWGKLLEAGVGLAASQYLSGKQEDAAKAAANAQAAAAGDVNALGREALQFAKDQWAEGRASREGAEARANSIAQALMATQAQQNEIAADYHNYNKTTFRPLEQRIVKEAQEYDTPERRAAAMAAARSDVEQSFGSAQEATSRAIARTGGSVSSGRSAALMQDAALAKAKAGAGATTQATRNVEQQGYARMMDAASLGRNLPSAQATAAGVGVQAANAGVNANNSALNASQAGTSQLQSAYGQAINAATSAGNLYGNVSTNQSRIDASNAAAWTALGKVGGELLSGYLSDETTKKGTGKRADPDESLEQIVNTPVDEGWQYDPAAGGVDDGGQRHTGPMAQAVRRSMGDAVAPGGKRIDIVTMNGRILSGMQALAKRLDRVEEKVAA